MFGHGPSACCLDASFCVHCLRVVRALMAWAEIRLCRALHANGTLGGRVIEAARIGSIGPCAYTTFWITGSLILVVNGTVPGVLLRVCRR